MESDAKREIARELSDLCTPSHQRDLYDRLQRLSDKELLILFKRLKEVPVEKIANELGVSSSRISQLAHRAVKKFCEEPRKEPRHGDE